MMGGKTFQQCPVQSSHMPHQLIKVIVWSIQAEIESHMSQLPVLVHDERLLLPNGPDRNMARWTARVVVPAPPRQPRKAKVLPLALCAGSFDFSQPRSRVKDSQRASLETGLMRYSLQPARIASRISAGSSFSDSAIKMALPCSICWMVLAVATARSWSWSKSMMQIEASAFRSFSRD